MKDAKGHGSDARGGEGPHRKSSHVKQLERLGLAGRGGGKFDETYGLKGGTPIGDPARPGATFGGQPVASNSHAAATLASGAKSAPVDTHPAMADRPVATKDDVFMGDAPNYRSRLR